MKATQPIRKRKNIRKFANYFLTRGQIRNYIFFIVSCYTALRNCDILRLVWDDVYDFTLNRVRSEIYVIEKKTKKSKIIKLNHVVISALALFAPSNAEKGKFLIENARTKKAISRVQAYRIIVVASEHLQLEYRISLHSLRKTFGYHAHKSGVLLGHIMEIYNHSSMAVTKRYLGITQDDINRVYLGIKLM